MPQVPADPDARVLPPPDPTLGEEETLIQSLGPQEIEGPVRRASEGVQIQTNGLLMRADRAEWNTETGEMEAVGDVYFENLVSGEQMRCERATYNLNTRSGTFYQVQGTAPARLETRPGVLSTDNPFYFEGEYATVEGDRYILHNGFLTDCLMPNPWWKLTGSEFEVIPGRRAVTRSAWLRLKGVPIFYAPYFYKSLEKQPRRSGFLTPNIGNSSFRGQTVGVGYYWAINRSSDLTYRTQWYTERGFAHQTDYRLVLGPRTDFSVAFFGVGTENENSRAGYTAQVDGRAQLGKGWEARGELRQISALAFRQEFSQSFDDAVQSETHSIGFVTKHWSSFGVNVIAQRNVNQDIERDQEVVIRKLPELQFKAREHQLGNLPLWVSLDSSFGLQRRSQPAFQTRQFVQRADFAPRLMTAFHVLGFHFAPSVGIRETFYDSRFADNPTTGQGALRTAWDVSGENLLRSSRDVTVEMVMPSLARVTRAPAWMGAGDQIKHVIEPRVTYRYATGIDDFNHVLRFDELDLLSNTHEVEFSLTNRILARDGVGGVRDLISWQLWYKRYFDPTFGGAIIPGRRNVIASAVDLTGYAFIDEPRNQSPVVSAFRIEGRVSAEWRADFDPVRNRFVNSSLSVSTRFDQLSVSAGHAQLRTDRVLAPNSNQIRLQGTFGGDNRRGWNYGAMMFYDYKVKKFQEFQAQFTYNTDCCGFSVQYRRPNFSSFQDHQIRVALALSNIGSFGTLQRQQRTF